MNEIKKCEDCIHYFSDYDCREYCEGRDMWKKIIKRKNKHDDLIKILKCRKDAEERRDNDEELYDCRYCRDCDGLFDRLIEILSEKENKQ